MPTLGELHKLETLVRAEYDDDLRVSTISGVKFRLFSSTKSKSRIFNSYTDLLNFLRDEFIKEHTERMRILEEFYPPTDTALDRYYATRQADLFGDHAYTSGTPLESDGF